jgi:hypothetical protein
MLEMRLGIAVDEAVGIGKIELRCRHNASGLA